MAAPKLNPPRDALIVAVLKLLPEAVRERFCYVAMVAFIALAWIGLHHEPTFTWAGSGITGIGIWIKSLLARLGG